MSILTNYDMEQQTRRLEEKISQSQLLLANNNFTCIIQLYSSKLIDKETACNLLDNIMEILGSSSSMSHACYRLMTQIKAWKREINQPNKR